MKNDDKGKYLLILDHGVYEGHAIHRYETEEALTEAFTRGRPLVPHL